MKQRKRAIFSSFVALLIGGLLGHYAPNLTEQERAVITETAVTGTDIIIERVSGDE